MWHNLARSRTDEHKEQTMADELAIHGIEPSLYEQALLEISEADDRGCPIEGVPYSVAVVSKMLTRDHAETMFLIAWRLAVYLRDQLHNFRAHLDELVPESVGLEAHRDLTHRFQKRFDNEDVIARCLMRTFANVGITEHTAWSIVEAHFSK